MKTIELDERTLKGSVRVPRNTPVDVSEKGFGDVVLRLEPDR